MKEFLQILNGIIGFIGVFSGYGFYWAGFILLCAVGIRIALALIFHETIDGAIVGWGIMGVVFLKGGGTFTKITATWYEELRKMIEGNLDA